MAVVSLSLKVVYKLGVQKPKWMWQKILIEISHIWMGLVITNYWTICWTEKERWLFVFAINSFGMLFFEFHVMNLFRNSFLNGLIYLNEYIIQPFNQEFSWAFDDRLFLCVTCLNLLIYSIKTRLKTIENSPLTIYKNLEDFTSCSDIVGFSFVCLIIIKVYGFK